MSISGCAAGNSILAPICSALVIALLSFLLWLRVPTRWVLFWTTGFALAQPAILLLLNAHMGWPYSLAMGAAQPLSAMRDVSLWFLLVRLLVSP
jgi:diguanylate cyclase